MSRSSAWIRDDKREAIYRRDGFACVYCHAADDGGHPHGLDHLTPTSRGGSNEYTNLVTACHRCNSSKRGQTLREYVTDPDERRRIRNQGKRRITAILKRIRFERAVEAEVQRRTEPDDGIPF